MTKRNRLNAQSVAIISRPDLRLDWCSHNAAKYAVEHWHYSKSLPTPPLVKIGVWEEGKFIGCVLFSHGANYHIGDKWGASQFEVCELSRIALTKHKSPVSRIGSIALKLFSSQSSGVQLIISYADRDKGHHGGIYQAMNWAYIGLSGGSEKVWYKGQWVHKRTVDSKYGNHIGFETIKTEGKHTYCFPLTSAMKAQLSTLSKPYPKRPKDSSEPSAIHAGEGGAAPTRALQNLFPLRDRMSRLVTG